MTAVDRPDAQMTAEERGAALMDPACDPRLLDELAADGDVAVRVNVALHRAAWPSTVERLAYDVTPLVRTCVAASDKVSPDTVARLLFDDDRVVGKSAAWNVRVPADALARAVSEHPDRVVRSEARGAAFDRVDAAYEMWKTVAADLRSPRATRLLIAAVATGARVLRKSAVDPDPAVRLVAARNPRLPADAVRGLMHDYDGEVRLAAQRRRATVGPCCDLGAGGHPLQPEA